MNAKAGGDRPIRRRSWAEVRWRQFRNAPRPVVRAVASSLGVAIALGLVYLAYDVAVLGAGTIVTWLVVPQPTGSGRVARRSAWSAALGFFAAVPIAYLVMVVIAQILRPLLT
jgi:hypothetical protein